MQPTDRQVQSCCWVLLVLVSLSFLQHLSITALHHHITVETLQMDAALATGELQNLNVTHLIIDGHHFNAARCYQQ